MISKKPIYPVLLVLAIVFTGCGGPKVKGLAPVRGTVTYDGTPLEGATVSFVPKDFSDGNRLGAGMTDSSGRFELRTIGEPGVLPNDYTVIVIKNTVEPVSSSKAPGKGEKPSCSPQRPKNKVVSVIPEKYGNAKTSGLEFTVGKGGLKDVQIDLTD